MYVIKDSVIQIEFSYQKYTLILDSFNDNVRTSKNWSAKRVMERDCLYARKSEEGIVNCDRKATTAVWEVKRAEWRGF